MKGQTRRTARCVIYATVWLALGGAVTQAKAQTYPPQPYPGYPPQYPQQPYPHPQVPPVGPVPSQPGTPLPEYHTPLIIVAAPAQGSTLPDDKPVVVLRFMSNEPTDPIDALTFSVTMDGKDKTSLFQLTQGEAWGRIAEPSEVLTAGSHDIAARICTAHGECGTTKATLTVVSSSSVGQVASATAAVKAKKKAKIFDAVLQAARVLFH
jgi:hypothetical protein